MKNFILGLVIGAVVTGIIGYTAAIPKIKQEAYDTGMAEGTKKGEAAGNAAGIAEGLAQAQTKMQAEQSRAKDSLAALLEKERTTKKVVYKEKDPTPAVQNWHVIGGNIADPIAEDKEPAKAPAATEQK
ncbi:MAG: hypothetical protein QM743_03035 [Chitinophagaceae bacterium]